MKLTKRKALLAWHFLPDNRQTEYTHVPVEVGTIITARNGIQLCCRGPHASLQVRDALRYASGSVICRVKCWGDIIQDDTKFVSTHRQVIAMADATNVLHEFACVCAESVFHLAGEYRPVCEAAVAAKRGWLAGIVSLEGLHKARAAAWARAEAAAWAAAEAAAWAAAWAAWAARAEAAAWARAEAAASARVDQQNATKLEEMIERLISQ
jgi:hypothetical protein